jgi:nitrous oxidase accessory protein NosD
LIDGAGISLLSADSFNMILKNRIENCANGITLERSFFELVFGNRIIASPGFGIYTGMGVNMQSPGPGVGGDHLIYGNDLDGNAVNARDDSVGTSSMPANLWDNGYYGNHFSDYDEETEGCADRDGDRICDDPHPIPDQPAVMDRFPQVEFAVGK